MISIPIKTQQLLALIKNALDLNSNHQLFESCVNWDGILDLASQQGVVSIAFDGIQKLPGKLMPEMTLLMDWCGQCTNSEIVYKHYSECLIRLVRFFSHHGISVLILKGLPLSKNYPVPHHRQCGDIDIYLFGDYEKANKILEDAGMSVNYEDPKHSIFYVDDIMVENHKTLFNTTQSGIEHYTESLVAKDLDDCILTDEGYYILPPTTNYLFLLRHLAKHFGDNEGVTLRQILDFGLFIKSKHSTLEINEIQNLVRSSGLAKINDIFVSIACECFGLNIEDYIFDKVNKKDEQRVFDDIFVSYRSHDFSHNRLMRIAEKLNVLMSQRWKYRLLPESYYSRIRRSWIKAFNQNG